MSMRPLSRRTVAISVCALLLLLGTTRGWAQESQQNAPLEQQPQSLTPAAHFTHLTSDDGLIQNSVTAIVQDNQGFMWIGTQAGLSRYDGYTFKNYQHDPTDPNSLSNNFIRDIYVDTDGILWMGTEGGGVSRFDPLTESFSHLQPSRENPNAIAGDRVFHVFQEQSGAFWFVGAGLTGLNRYDPATETFRNYTTAPNEQVDFEGGAVFDMLEDANGDLWLASSTELSRYHPDTDTFSFYQVPEVNGRREDRLVYVHIDADGTLWAGGTNGLYEFDSETESLIHREHIPGITAILDTNDGLLWITSTNGLVLYDPRARQIVRNDRYDALEPTSLSSDSLSEIYQDREGLLWIGTREDGINIYNPRQARFAHYRHYPDNPASLADGLNTMFAAEDGVVWAGAGSTLERLDLENNQVTHYPLPTDSGSPASISAVHQDHTGIVWVGIRGLQIYSFDPETEQFTSYPLEGQNPRPSPPKAVIKIVEDEDNYLWVAVNHDGFYRFDPSRENVDYFDGPASGTSILAGTPPQNAPHPPITDFVIDEDGYIWVTTLNGFVRFDPDSAEYSYFRALPGNAGPDSYMEAVLQSSDGLIWVASRDGLIRFESETETSTYYTERDGLPSSYVVSLLEAENGDLWLGTTRGLSRFTPSTETFRNFDMTDGLQGSEFVADAFAQTPDGRMLFGGANGLTVFYPQTITDSAYEPPVMLTDFQLSNIPVEPGQNSPLQNPIWNTNTLTLDYLQNNLSFEFAALSFAAPEKTRYRYMLEGFETDWNETASTRRFVSYTNLPAGDYVLRVEATNADGIWSGNAVALNMTVHPPVWETVWFRTLMSILVVALVIGGYQWRVYSIARRNHDLEREVDKKTSALQERTQALQTSETQLRAAKEAAEAANRAKSAFIANMSHELRSPLNAILGFAQVTNRLPDLPAEVYENLNIVVQSGEHLLTLINQVLDLSKIEAGQMVLNEVNVDLYGLLNELEKLFQLKADSKQLKLVFERDANVPRYIYTDAVKLRQVLINLIGNALKFTDKGTVSVRVRKLTGETANTAVRLQFEVTDTGPGIAADELAMIFEAFSQSAAGRQSQEGTGLGLTISRRFVTLMGGEISVKSEVGQGSTFTFSIQCQVVAVTDDADSKPTRRVVALEPGQPIYRILVVDDRWANRRLLTKLLLPFGFDLREAENGKEAIEIAQVFQPHVIFMDLRMPVIDGLEATHQIKAMADGQNVKIIALTASVFEEERSEVIARGCDDFVRKPFHDDEIFAVLKRHLNIEYVYARDAHHSKPQTDRIQPDVLRAAMSDLPPSLREDFTEAIELGDMEMLDKTLKIIAAKNANLAANLGQLADRFDYDTLLSLVRETVQ